MLISTDDKRIHFLSEVYAGKTHDYSLLKHEFPPDKDWFSELKVRVDLGYQGFATDYQCKKAFIPNKKPKNQDLTEQQRAENKEKSKKRIYVEHSIGGMKKYHFLNNRLRTKDFNLYNQALGVCAALWNFSLK
jgi:hypothetical protein